MPTYAIIPTAAESIITPDEENNSSLIHNISAKNIDKFETKLVELNDDPSIKKNENRY